MPTYLVLAKWTPKALENLKIYRQDPSGAIREAEDFMKKLGAEIKAWYVLMGRFDEACILEAPDDATMARIALAIGERYAIKTETLRAFDVNEALKFIMLPEP
jgi:uncharacterized protein with GYD domain